MIAAGTANAVPTSTTVTSVASIIGLASLITLFIFFPFSVISIQIRIYLIGVDYCNILSLIK